MIPAQSCDRLMDLQGLRNRIQHVYPDVKPEEIHEAVRTLRAEVTGFVDRYERWLADLGRDSGNLTAVDDVIRELGFDDLLDGGPGAGG